MDLVAVPKTVTAWRDYFREPARWPPIVVTKSFHKTRASVFCSLPFGRAITPILLDRRSYYPPEMHDNCIHQPDLLLTFSDGSRVLDVEVLHELFNNDVQNQRRRIRDCGPADYGRCFYKTPAT